MNIPDKLNSLVNLAKNPGNEHEGQAAKLAAIRLSEKYGIPCEFTNIKSKPNKPNIPNVIFSNSTSNDKKFYVWIQALARIGWIIKETTDLNIGKQIKFRKPGLNSEVVVTQRKYSNGDDFEAEHITNPDLVIKGKNMSTCCYITIDLNQLLKHLSFK